MTASLIGVIVLEAVVAALVAGAVHTALRRRERLKLRQLVAIAKREEKARCDFRRPAEFGSLTLPWDDVDRIRTAIAASQNAYREGETSRCITFHGLPYGLVSGPGLLDEDVPSGYDPDEERSLFWMVHHQGYAPMPLTGRGVAA